MRSLKIFCVLILFFCLGKHVEANAVDVPETYDFNNEKFDLLLQRLEHVESRNNELERKIESVAADFREKEESFNARIAELEKLNNLKDNECDKDKQSPDERLDDLDDTNDDENVRVDTNAENVVPKQRRTMNSGRKMKLQMLCAFYEQNILLCSGKKYSKNGSAGS